MRRGRLLCSALLLAAAGCGAKPAMPELAWKPPPGPPSVTSRTDDQAEPRLEALADPVPQRAAADDLDQAAALSSAAAARRAAGDLSSAIDMQSRALEIRERVLGPDHPDVASTLTSLATLYALQDNYGAAQPKLQRALLIREQALGPDDPLTAASLSNLALLYAAEGRPADAEPLYQRAVAILEKTRSADLPAVLENYAALLADTGRVEDAAKLDAQAARLRATHPPER